MYQLYRKGGGHIEAVREVGHLNVMDTECLEILRECGFTDDDIVHFEATPADLREQVRAAMFEAVGAGLPCWFGWKPTGAEKETVRVKQGSMAVQVVFEIPRRVREPALAS
jgi:hypothetical protein